MNDTLRLRVHGINSLKKGIQHLLKTSKSIDELAIDNDTPVDYFAVPEHNELYKKMLRKKGKNTSMKTIMSREIKERSTLSQQDFMVLENSKKLSDHFQQRNIMRIQDEREVKELTMAINGSLRVPSSFNGITFSVNEGKGCIDFEFSIPKYLYGHSLAEFIPQILSDFVKQNYTIAHTWKFVSKIMYDRLIQFIDLFIVDISNFYQLDQYLNKNYIEILRLDFCKNQFFNTKADSLSYLENLFRLNVRRKSNENKKGHHATTLEYFGAEGTYFKIYHKGTEYSDSPHGDRKKHMEENTKVLDRLPLIDLHKEIYKENRGLVLHLFDSSARGVPPVLNEEKKLEIKKTINGLYKHLPYKIDFLKQEMDKVLRYEITLRSKWFSYQYKTKLFRKDDVIHQIALKKYKETKSKYDGRNTGIENKTSYKEKQNYDNIHDFLNRTTCFVLNNGYGLRRFETSSSVDYKELNDSYKPSRYQYVHSFLSTKDVAFFSPELFMLGVKKFYAEYKYYQVKRLDSFDDLATKISKYNDEVKDRVEAYNALHISNIKGFNGCPKYKKASDIQYANNDIEELSLIKRGYKKLKKATDLLTQSELADLGLKTISTVRVFQVVNLMKEKKWSLNQIRLKLKFSSSAWSRLRKDLKIFGIFEQSIEEPIPIETCVSWKKYYENMDRKDYRDNFFRDQSMFYND
tara:strand:+ start:23534 stop:25600 length:2067 start_codon:yes stop_codon:yes gene_type:complete